MRNEPSLMFSVLILLEVILAPLAAQQKGHHGARHEGIKGELAASWARCGAAPSTPAAQLPTKQTSLSILADLQPMAKGRL